MRAQRDEMTRSEQAAVSPTEVVARYEEVRGRIADAAKRSGRSAEDVLLVAVTKYAEPEAILALIEHGHRDFGEGRVQQLTQRASMSGEWEERAGVLAQTSQARGGLPTEAARLRWHMIGHIQRNKAKKVAEFCRLVHSVDNFRVAEELQQALVKTDRTLDVLLQVDCSGEETKYGCPMPAVIAMAEQIETMYSIRLRGLMTMAPHTEDPEDARPVFRRCRELFEEMRTLGVAGDRFNILSMGMTHDYEVAISEGASVVRVGSAIFGDPPARDEDEDED